MGKSAAESADDQNVKVWPGVWRRARSANSVTALVTVVGLTVSLAAGVGLAYEQRATASEQLQRRATLVTEAVSSETGRYIDSLRTVAAAAGAFEPLTAGTFADVTRPLAGMGLAGATSIAFLVPAVDADIAEVQQRWRGRGVPELTLQPKSNASEHIFSIFSQAMDGTTTARHGIDVTQSAAPTQALTESRRSGRVTVSDPYQLIIDQALPAELRQMSFTFTAPVYGPSAANGTRAFRGWVLMGVRGQALIGGTLARVSQNLVDVTLRAPRADGTYPTVATQHATVTGERDLRADTQITVADRRWQLHVEAAGLALPGAATGMPSVVTSAGAALTLLLAGLVWILATGRARAQARVRAATVELATAGAAAREQATLLTAILDCIGDGVGVVDTHGEFILHNPAAKAMLGLTDDVSGPDNWQGHYGLFRPDGHARFPTDELPLVRALAGETVEQQELLVRNAGHPDGITISVSARPLLSSAGHTGAVAVFHDITARKAADAELASTIAALREREADLRAFAGVAAHDLKAPLAAVAGYAEILDDELPDGADSTMRHSVKRIRAGVDRMRRLIDDLLAYATARDVQLHPEPVDLQRVVADVIAELTAPLRGADADAQPALFPEIYTGPLPVVYADKAMIRQLLDNLLGNALKYSTPGQPAHIDISAHHRTGDTSTRVEIADRGIGIPDPEKPHIFTPFHRARNHGDRPGTGLGLAICQRIIGRHQATIGVADNPGGGTRIHFTLATTSGHEPAATGRDAEADASVSC